jgi:hypothetical protein
VADAKESAKQAVLYSPNFAMAHLLLAQIRQRENNPAAVVEELDAYLRIEPNGARSAGVKAARDQAARSLAEESIVTADSRVY